jgi:hypothetical protein
MRRIKVSSLTQGVKDWLANTHQPRVLHVFDDACNLINESRDVLSIVTPRIGNGPFNLVLEEKVLFAEYLDVVSEIAIHEEQIVLGELTIDIANAQLWNPRPDWGVLYAGREDIANRVAKLPMTNDKPNLPDDLLSTLADSIVSADTKSTQAAARQLAGLGQGLTPAGDDFMIGAIYAAWIIHPPDVGGELAEGVAKIAAPLTTSLSAAWLRCAGRGEAGILWHEFFDALNHANASLQSPISRLLAVGETSGADALSGFMGTLESYMALLSRKRATSSGE